MAKKTKTNRAKMPKVQKLSQEQMDNFLAAIMNSNIGAENAEFAKMLIHGNALKNPLIFKCSIKDQSNRVSSPKVH